MMSKALKSWLTLVVLSTLALTAAACGGSASRRAAEDLENDPQNHYRWAREQHLRGYYKEALESINKAIALEPDSYLFYNERGLIHLNAGQAEDALVDFTMVAEINPLYTDVHNNLGATLAKLGRLDEARVEFEKVLEDPLYQYKELAHANLGDMLFAARDYDGAISEFRKSLSIRPDYLRAHYKIGLCYQALGDEQRARDSFKEVVRIAPHTDEGRESQQILRDLDRAN